MDKEEQLSWEVKFEETPKGWSLHVCRPNTEQYFNEYSAEFLERLLTHQCRHWFMKARQISRKVGKGFVRHLCTSTVLASTFMQASRSVITNSKVVYGRSCKGNPQLSTNHAFRPTLNATEGMIKL
jgi:hypothetical protein